MKYATINKNKIQYIDKDRVNRQWILNDNFKSTLVLSILENDQATPCKCYRLVEHVVFPKQAMKSGYQHTSSDWQFSPANTFGTIVHQSLGNSTNLNSYTLPGAVNLTSNTTYYVRIRFNINPT